MKETDLCDYCRKNIKEGADFSGVENPCPLCGYDGKEKIAKEEEKMTIKYDEIQYENNDAILLLKGEEGIICWVRNEGINQVKFYPMLRRRN